MILTALPLQTGAIYPASLIASFADLAVKHRLPLIIDETYRDFVTTEAPPHALFTRAEPWRPNFIHLFSFSKSYCLPGYRLGAIAASPEYLVSVKTVLDCLQICPPGPVRLGLAPLLPSLRAFVSENDGREQVFEKRVRIEPEVMSAQALPS